MPLGPYARRGAESTEASSICALGDQFAESFTSPAPVHLRQYRKPSSRFHHVATSVPPERPSEPEVASPWVSTLFAFEGSGGPAVPDAWKLRPIVARSPKVAIASEGRRTPGGAYSAEPSMSAPRWSSSPTSAPASNVVPPSVLV